MGNSGRAGGIRTHGLFDPNEALYQAEPQPELFEREIERGGVLWSTETLAGTHWVRA